MSFERFKKAVQQQFGLMQTKDLYIVDADKDTIWSTYLDSFPEGTNPMMKERTEHDCQCCKQFIRTLGKVVAFDNGEMMTIWDVEVDDFYQEVANSMAKYIKGMKVQDEFFHYERRVGTDHNFDQDGNKYTHFACDISNRFIKSKDDIPTLQGYARTQQQTLTRSLEELSQDSMETVLELIDQNSLYRGEEHKSTVKNFLKEKKKYGKLRTKRKKEAYTWSQSKKWGTASNVRGTAIGTLLVDLSEGKDLEQAVKSFENKVAPHNYKRTTALVTPRMIENAQKTVEELGYTDSLNRRHARTDDLKPTNVIYVDREAKKQMGVFDELKKSAATPKKLGKVEEVSIEKFLSDVIPHAESIEMLFENRHIPNLMSVISPEDKDAKGMFKWGNNFSWTYNGELADSNIAEKVKAAGGDIVGDLRCSLAWFNYDDLDFHMSDPRGGYIDFSKKGYDINGGKLDVDMNAGGGHTREPVENIVYKDHTKMPNGTYKLMVHQFTKRETNDVGFQVEVEFNGTIYTFCYDKAVKPNEKIEVAQIKHTNGKFEIVKSLPHTKMSKEVWGVNTEQFQKVKMVMNSPNHWDGEETGNKHWFFILEDCKNPDKARGFYNEFLAEELTPHRKVFELLGSKLRVEESEDQISGAGFSSTVRNNAFFKVTGKTQRTLKVLF